MLREVVNYPSSLPPELIIDPSKPQNMGISDLKRGRKYYRKGSELQTLTFLDIHVIPEDKGAGHDCDPMLFLLKETMIKHMIDLCSLITWPRRVTTIFINMFAAQECHGIVDSVENQIVLLKWELNWCFDTVISFHQAELLCSNGESLCEYLRLVLT